MNATITLIDEEPDLIEYRRRIGRSILSERSLLGITEKAAGIRKTAKNLEGYFRTEQEKQADTLFGFVMWQLKYDPLEILYEKTGIEPREIDRWDGKTQHIERGFIKKNVTYISTF